MNKLNMFQSVRKYLSLFPESKKNQEKIIKAIEKTDRKKFMEKNKTLAYEDSAIPIGHGQTISQPSTVARMISLLKLKKTDEILEIGTGSAWNAAVMSKLAKHILTLEIVPELAKKSQEKIKNIKNIEVQQKDFRKLKQKFDKIIFTAGIFGKILSLAKQASIQQEKIMENFAKKHLKENGILICPYQSGPLIIFNYKKGKIKKNYSEEHYVFVPLILN